jgi:hypothetical protein
MEVYTVHTDQAGSFDFVQASFIDLVFTSSKHLHNYCTRLLTSTDFLITAQLTIRHDVLEAQEHNTTTM